MVAAGVLVEGREIRLGALTFVADDSAWLQEAPLDVDALPVRGATHFRACVRGVLLRQPSTPYRSTPPSPTGLPPAQALGPVEASAVGEARGGSPDGHHPSCGNRARRISLRPVRLAP